MTIDLVPNLQANPHEVRLPVNVELSFAVRALGSPTRIRAEYLLNPRNPPNPVHFETSTGTRVKTVRRNAVSIPTQFITVMKAVRLVKQPVNEARLINFKITAMVQEIGNQGDPIGPVFQLPVRIRWLP